MTRSCGIELALTLPVRAAPAGGEHTRRNPTDHGKLAANTHLLVAQRGLPLVAKISGAHVHDSRFLIPLVDAIQLLVATELIRIVSDDEEPRRKGERMHNRYFILGTPIGRGAVEQMNPKNARVL